MDHTDEWTQQQEDYDAEWMQLEQEIINFLNSDPEHQHVENIVLSGERDHGGLPDQETICRHLSTSYDGDDHQTTSHDSNYYDTESFRLAADERVQEIQETAHVSELESALGRSWTQDDAMRIFSIMNEEIENQGGDSWAQNLTDQEYDDMLSRAIYQDLENLRANGDLDPNWTEDNEGILFLDIILEIQNLVLGWNRNLEFMINVDVSDDEEGDGLSEETMSRYLKTRSCDEGSTASTRDEEPELCIVCQDQLYQEHGTIATLACGHEYHVDCIKQWLQGKNLCPLCKAKALHADSDSDE
ncbi:hypothetical protein Pfo_010988 [Paulownia fortunei]|nr:hypothetical protein Pfo_010988 [Paulownia fortunei]